MSFHARAAPFPRAPGAMRRVLAALYSQRAPACAAAHAHGEARHPHWCSNAPHACNARPALTGGAAPPRFGPLFDHPRPAWRGLRRGLQIQEFRGRGKWETHFVSVNPAAVGTPHQRASWCTPPLMHATRAHWCGSRSPSCCWGRGSSVKHCDKKHVNTIQHGGGAHLSTTHPEPHCELGQLQRWRQRSAHAPGSQTLGEGAGSSSNRMRSLGLPLAHQAPGVRCCCCWRCC